MKIELDTKERRLLQDRGIAFKADGEYSEVEAFRLLELVSVAEVFYAMEPERFPNGEALAAQYAHIYDKIFDTIPE